MQLRLGHTLHRSKITARSIDLDNQRLRPIPLGSSNRLFDEIQEDKDGMCKVVMTESGFEKLSTEMAENAFKQNSGGWDYMLGRLEKLFQG